MGQARKEVYHLQRKLETQPQLQWKVEGRRFRTPQEYAAALRDKQLIDSIMADVDLNKKEDIKRLYEELRKGRYQFESVVGRQFDDNVYELYQRVKAREAESELQKKEQLKKRQEKLAKAKEKLTMVKTEASAGKKENSAKKKIRLEDFDKDMQKEILLEMKKKEKNRRRLIRVCVLLCIVCFGYFICYYKMAGESADEFSQLAALKENPTYFNSDRQITVHKVDATSQDNMEILPEYQTLYNKNRKLIGWVKIDDTQIDYPVMQTVNNEYYLNHNFNQEEDRNGCIFMDYQCDVVKGCDNMILYGHHMQSGKMFGGLNKYSRESYYKEHPRIRFDTIYEKGEYEVMYVFRSKVYSEEEVTFKYYQFINASSEQEFNSYMNEMKALSLYDTGVTAVYGDRLLTLSTCDYQENDGRFVVVAKRVN